MPYVVVAQRVCIFKKKKKGEVLRLVHELIWRLAHSWRVVPALFLLTGAPAALSEEQPKIDEPDVQDLAVLALDPAAQRAVVRTGYGRPTLIVRGGLIPGTRLRLEAVLADRIEVESTLRTARAQRWWYIPSANGDTQRTSVALRPGKLPQAVSPTAHGASPADGELEHMQKP